MWKVINPTEKDIGRTVIYSSYPDQKEWGAITSFNNRCVFVRYEKQHPTANGQATSREDLDWSVGSDTQGEA